MDLIMADKRREELSYIDVYTRFDAELSLEASVDANTWQLDMPRSIWLDRQPMVGGYIYVPGTPYGGMIDYIKVDDQSVTLMGATWEGALARYVAPYDGQQDGLSKTKDGSIIVNCSPVALAKALIGRDDIVIDGDTQTTIKGRYRYDTALKVLRTLLDQHDMQMHTVYDGRSKALRLTIQKIESKSRHINISVDYGARMEFCDDYLNGYSHILLAGTGEGTARKLYHAYLTVDGKTVPDKSPYVIDDGRVYLYDYNTIDNAADALDACQKKFTEIGRKRSVRVTIPPSQLALNLSDIVTTSDRELNIRAESKIIKKILRMTPISTAIEYEAESKLRLGGQ